MPGFQEKILTTPLNPVDEDLAEVPEPVEMESVFGNSVPRKVWSNMHSAALVVAVQLIEEIAVAVPGKIHMRVAQQLGVDNLVAEGDIVVRGLKAWAHILKGIFPLGIGLEEVVVGIGIAAGGLVR